MYIKLVEAIVDMREEAFAHADTPRQAHGTLRFGILESVLYQLL
jgi:hypothetical protein